MDVIEQINDTIKDAFQTGKQPNVNHNILAKLPILHIGPQTMIN